MATEADIPEPVSITEIEAENKYLTSKQHDRIVNEFSQGELEKFQGMNNQPPETTEFSAQTQNKQVASDFGVETITKITTSNVGTSEGESFFESSSASKLAHEETCKISENCQADEIPFQVDKKLSEDEKQMQNDVKFDIAEETGGGENEVMEGTEERAEKSGMCHDILNLTGTSVQTATIEEPNFKIGEEKSLEEERILDQHVEVIANQHASVEENLKSNEKEFSDSQKLEKEMIETGETAEFESGKEILNIFDVTSGQNKEEGIIDTKFIEEEREETSVKELEVKESEKSPNLVDEETGPQAIKPDETARIEKDVEKLYDSIEDVSTSTVAASPNIQNDAEAIKDIREGAKEELYKPSVTTEVSSMIEAGPEFGKELEEASDIACTEKSQDTIESSEKTENIPSVVDEMHDTNKLDTSPVTETEKVCLQTVDNPEIFKEVPEIRLEDIVKESSEEVKDHNEILEKISQTDSATSEKCKDYENPEDKVDASFLKDEGMQSVDEGLDTTDASARESTNEGGSTVVVGNDNINETELIAAVENSRRDLSKHGSPEESLLQQNEPENEKLERSLSIVSEGIHTAASSETITCVTEETPIKSHEEGSEEKGIEDTQIQNDDAGENVIPKEENLPPTELNEKIGSVEAEITNTNPIDVHVTHPLAEEAEQKECEKLNKVSNEDKAEKSKGEDSGEQIIEESNVKDLSPEVIGEGPVKNFQDDEKEAKKSEGEIFEGSETAEASKSIEHETSQTVESPKDVVDASKVIQEESRNLAPVEASPEEKRNEDGSSIVEGEENSTETKIVEVKGDFEEGEDDSKQIFKGLQSEDKSLTPAEASPEEKRNEDRPSVVMTEETGRDAELVEPAGNVEKCEEDSKQTLQKNETGEMLDTSLVKKEEILQNEGKNLDLTEASPEEKRNEDSVIGVEENGSDTKPVEAKGNVEKDEEDAEQTEAVAPNADDMEEGAVQKLEETPEKEEKDNSGTKANVIAKDIEIVVETSDASESTESIEQEIKKETKEEYESSEISSKVEETETHIIKEYGVSDITPEIIGEETVKNSEGDENEKQMPKVEVYEELQTTSVGEDAEKQMLEEKNTIEENLKSIEKEFSDSQKNEKEMTETGETADLESGKEILNILEATAGQNKEASIHEPDLTVMEACKKEEGIIDTKFIEEAMEETSFKEVEVKESEKSPDLVDEETGPEAIKPGETAGIEKDVKEKKLYAEDVSTSTVAASPNIQNDAEAIIDIGEGAKEELHKPSVIMATEVSSMIEAGPEFGELKEASDIACIEKIQDTIESSEKTENIPSVEDEMHDTNKLDTSLVTETEKTCLQAVDNPTIFKEVPEIRSEGIVKESPEEVEEKTEILEKIVQTDSTASEKGKDHENPDEKVDASFMKDEGMQSIGEGLDTIDASARENTNEGDSTVVVGNDNISDTEIIAAVEECQRDMSKHEGSREESLLQKNEPKNEKWERSLSIGSEEIHPVAFGETVTCVPEETPIESHEEAFQEKGEEDTPIQNDAAEEKGTLREKNLLPVVISDAKASIKIKSNEFAGDEKVKQRFEGESILEATPAVSGEDESNKKEDNEERNNITTEEVQDGPKTTGTGDATNEQIIQDNITCLSPELIEEETVQSSHENENKAEKCEGEDIIEQTIEKSNIVDLSPEVVGVKNFQDDGKEAEKSEGEIFERSDTAGESESVANETSHTVESPKDMSDTSMVKQEESSHSEIKNLSPTEAAPEEKRNEEISSVIVSEQNSSDTELVEVQENVEEGEDDLKQILQKNETGEMLDTSLEKQEEGFQSESKNLCPTEATPEEKINVDSSSVVMTEETDRDAELVETARNVEKCEAGEMLDTSLVKQEETLQNEGKNLNLTEAAPEEKRNEDSVTGAEQNSGDAEPVEAKGNVEKGKEDLKQILQENETGEELERSLDVMPEETEVVTPNADDIEEGAVQNLEETLEKDTETKDKNGTKDNLIAKDIEIAVETSDASESTENLEGKDAVKNIEEEIKKETKEEYEGSEIASTGEKTETYIIKEECGASDITPEIIGEETLKSIEGDENEKQMPKVEVYEELQTTSVGEDAEKQILEEKNTIEGQTTILDGMEKIEEISKEDNKVAKIPKQENIEEGSTAEDKENLGDEPEEEVQDGPKNTGTREATNEQIIRDNITCLSPELIEEETVQTSKDNENKVEKCEGEDSRELIIEKSNIEDLSPEVVGESPVKNFQDDGKDAEENSEGKIFEGSETAGASESAANETSQTVEIPKDMLDTSMVKQEESFHSESKNLTRTEASPEEKRNEDISSVIVSEQNSSDSELVEVKENVEEDEDDLKQILQKNETGEMIDNSLEKQEGFQSEGKNISPTEASPEEKINVDSSSVVMTEETDRDAELVETAGNVEKYEEDSKQILQENEAREMLDTSLVKQEEILQNAGKNLNLTEAAPEEKRNEDSVIGAEENSSDAEPVEAKGNVEKGKEDLKQILQENETGEELERSLDVMSEETEEVTPNADDMEERAVQKLEETIEKDKETKENNGTKDNLIAKDIEIVVETSDASESTENLEGKNAEKNIEEEIKKETKEEYEGSEIASTGEKTETHIIKEECGVSDITPEIIGEETLKSIEGDEDEKQKPKVEVYEELKTTSVGEDAESQILEEKNTIEGQTTILDGVEKIEEISKEDNKNIEEGSTAEDKENLGDEPEEEVQDGPKITGTREAINEQIIKDNITCLSPELIEEETVQTSKDDENKVEKCEGESSRELIIEKSNIEDLSLEVVGESPVKNFQDDGKDAEKSEGEVSLTIKQETGRDAELVETAGNVEKCEEDSKQILQENEAGEMLDTSLVKQEEILQNKGKNLNLTEAAPEEKRNEDSVIGAEENSSDTEPVEAKGNVEKGEEDSKQMLQEIETGEELERSLDVMSEETDAVTRNADDMEEGAVQKLEETLEKDKETKDNSGAKDNVIAKDTESERTDSIVLEPELTMGKMESETSNKVYELDSTENLEGKDAMKNIEEEIKKETKEEYEVSEIAGKSEETETHVIKEEYSVSDITPEITGEETVKSSEGDENEKQITKVEVYEELQTTSVGEDDEKQILEEKNTIEEQFTVLDGVEKIENDSKEDNIVSKNPEQEGCEIIETEDIGKQNIEEGGIVEDKENLGDEPEREVCKEFETAALSTSTDSQNIEEHTKPGLPLGEETVKESSKENESDAMQLKEEVDDSNSALIEKTEATGSAEETTSDTLKEPKNDPHALHSIEAREEDGDRVDNAWVSVMSEKDIREEISAKREITINDSDYVSVMVETEGAGYMEAEPEDKVQVESSNLASQVTETKRAMLDTVDISAKPENSSNLGERRNETIPTAADEAGEKMEYERQAEVPGAGSEGQKEETTGETCSKDISVDDLKENSTMPSQEHQLMTTKSSETTDETPARFQAPYENVEAPVIARATEEMLMQKEDKPTDSIDDSELRSVDTGKENEDVDVQKHTDEDLYVHPELDTEQYISKLQDVENLKREETGEVADQIDICESKSLKYEESSSLGLEKGKTEDEKQLDEASKCIETFVTCTDGEKDTLEQENFAKSVVDRSKEDIEVEKAAVEFEGGVHGHGHDKSKDDETPTEENLVTADLDERLKCASELVAEDQSNETLQESNKSEIEGNSNDIQDQEGEKEIKEEKEPKLEPEDRSDKEQNTNETMKAVILSEEVHEGVEKADSDEIVKEQVNDASPLSTEYLKATDSKREETVNKESEEEKAKEGGSEKPVDVSSTPAEESEEKIEKTIEETQNCYNKIDTATGTAVTAETSLREAKPDDKLVKTLNISSDETSLETTETVAIQQDNTVDSVKLEETSCDLASQIPANDGEHTEKESRTLENPDVVEDEETKIACGAVYESKDQETKETDETGKGPTVEKLDADKIEEETEEASNIVPDYKSQGVESVVEDEITADQTLPAEKPEEQLQTPSPIEEKKHITTTTVDIEEEDKTKEAEKLGDESPEDSSAAKTTKEKCLQTEGPSEFDVPKLGLELNDEDIKHSSNEVHEEERRTLDEVKEDTEKVSESASKSESQGIEAVIEDEITADQTVLVEAPSSSLLLKEQEYRTVTTTEKTEEKTKEVEMLQDETPENASAPKTTEETCPQTEEPRELKLSQLGLELNEDMQKECPIEVQKEEDGTLDEIKEEIKEASETEWKSKSEGVEAAKIIADQTLPLEISEEKHQTPSSELLCKEQEHGTTIENMEEKTKEVEILQDESPENSSATKTTEETCYQMEESRELEVSRLGLELDKDIQKDTPNVVHEEEGGILNDIKGENTETSETASKSSPQGSEAVTKDGIIADERLPEEKLEEKHQTPSSVLLSREQEYGTITMIENVEENMKELEMPEHGNLENSSAPKTTEEICLQNVEPRELEASKFGLEVTTDIQDNPNETHVEEDRILDKDVKLEPQEYENEMKSEPLSGSEKESENITELTRPFEKASSVKSETSEKAFESLSEVLTKSEDTEIKVNHPEAAVTDLKAEDNQTEKTIEATEIVQDAVLIEQIKEEKEDAKNCQPVSPGEETFKESHREFDLKAEENLGQNTNETFKTKTFQNEELYEEIEKAGTSENIVKQISAEEKVVVENETIKEELGKDVKEATSIADLQNQHVETNFGNSTTKSTTFSEEESVVEISQNEGTMDPAAALEATRDIQQQEKTSHAAYEKQISREAEPKASIEAMSAGRKDVPIVETLQSSKVGESEPEYTTVVDSGVKEYERGGEKRMEDSGEIKTEESASMISLSDLLTRSRKETPLVAEHLTEEKEPMASKEEMHVEDRGIALEKDEEEEGGDEHKKTDSSPDAPVMVEASKDSSPDAPVMVEASKDMDVKVAHKKSHNILSGVGSKVKHSLSKVKKAITGKSSHPKTVH